jgi:LPXTG-site transpeptidase (sortase) family protein
MRPRLAAGARRARRLLGGALIGGGTALVVASALAATGALPLWRPSVPAPPPAVLTPQPEAAAAQVALSAPRRSDPPTPTATLAAAARATAAAAALASMDTAVAPAPETADASATTEPTVGSSRALLPSRTPLASPTPWPTATPWLSPTLLPSPTPWPSSTPRPSPTALPTVVPPPPAPGLPVHLVIPSIRVDTPVVELDTRVDEAGALEWDTVPFVAGHYGVTGLAGASANVVLVGHVATQEMGNVFRELYRLQPGEPIVVYTADGEFTYRVEALRLVAPAEVDVLAPATAPRLTLVTCAGEFDFRTHSFSQRLVVVGRLVT